MEESEPRDSGNLTDSVREVLGELLRLMGLEAEVVPETGTLEEAGTDSIVFDVRGRDLGVLIGRRGQGLGALQYLVRLIVSHRTALEAPVIIDVEGYKRRRYESLRTLARNLAEQVKARQMPFALEPMSAFERRIIHLALANDPDVTTQSIGEGDLRKVVIVLREK